MGEVAGDIESARMGTFEWEEADDFGEGIEEVVDGVPFDCVNKNISQ